MDTHVPKWKLPDRISIGAVEPTAIVHGDAGWGTVLIRVTEVSEGPRFLTEMCRRYNLPDPTALREENKRLRKALEAGAEAINALRTMKDQAEPRKLDEALTWRQNDEKAEALADTALGLARQALAPVPAKAPGGEEGKDGAKVPALPL